ncbi:MAG: UPF0755 protein [Parcubacteria group bacterium LiPW_15]|nr:MAG: UPF0755 protein [Parcubacteria group bacterium LiPW_15]
MQFGEDPKIRFRARLVLLCFTGLILGFAIWFVAALKPVLAEKKFFTVSGGDGFRDVVEKLRTGGVIRSALAAKIYFLISGSAFHLQPGAYIFDPGEGVPKISEILRNGEKQTVKVVIPEGSSIYDIDGILANNFVVKNGEFVSWVKAQSIFGEGYFFPDTYDFFLESNPKDIAERMRANFDLKAKSILDKDPKQATRNLILASLLEREVPEFKDRQIAAGILLKRVKIGMPLQVDATICYLKEMAGETSCYPLSPADFKVDSPYNTYLNKGLPPGPIGNPGAESIKAAMAPVATSYWYYLSDPATGKTIWSETLDIHASNRVKYLMK